MIYTAATVAITSLFAAGLWFKARVVKLPTTRTTEDGTHLTLERITATHAGIVKAARLNKWAALCAAIAASATAATTVLG